jgi:hypothetical protein
MSRVAVATVTTTADRLGAALRRALRLVQLLALPQIQPPNLLPMQLLRRLIRPATSRRHHIRRSAPQAVASLDQPAVRSSSTLIIDTWQHAFCQPLSRTALWWHSCPCRSRERGSIELDRGPRQRSTLLPLGLHCGQASTAAKATTDRLRTRSRIGDERAGDQRLSTRRSGRVVRLLKGDIAASFGAGVSKSEDAPRRNGRRMLTEAIAPRLRVLPAGSAVRHPVDDFAVTPSAQMPPLRHPARASGHRASRIFR